MSCPRVAAPAEHLEPPPGAARGHAQLGGDQGGPAPGQRGHRAAEHADEQQVEALVVVLDLPGELLELVVQLLLGDEGLGEVSLDVRAGADGVLVRVLMVSVPPDS